MILIELHITPQVAALAKEKEFDVLCFDFYDSNDKLGSYGKYNPVNYNIYKNTRSAPTQALLQKWLREKHLIHISVRVHFTSPICYSYLVEDFDTNENSEESVFRFESNESYESYELTLENALFEALKRIKNGKQNTKGCRVF